MASIVPDRNRPTSGHTPRGYQNVRLPPHGGGNLIPERRADANGKIVTRWVKDDASNNEPSEALLVPPTAGKPPEIGLPSNVNWDECSSQKVAKLVGQLSDQAEDPDKVWDNYDLCTSLLASKYGPAALFVFDDLKGKLPRAWAAKHGVKLGSNESFDIEGDEGYKAFYAANDELRVALMSAQTRSYGISHDEHLMKQHVTRQIKKELPRSNGDYGLHELQARAEASRIPEAERDSIAEAVGDFVDLMGSTFIERQSEDIPENLKGTTVAWSDLNPFKRWGKKKV